MAAVTLLGTATFNTSNGSKAVTATPAVGDLIVIVAAHTGNTADTAPTDNNSSGTYTRINGALKASSADKLNFFVRNSLIGSASSTVFTHAPGTTSGGGLAVLKVTGMARAGSSASRQSGKQDNQAAATPAPVFGLAPLTANAIIGAVFNGTSPAGLTPRTNFAERVDLGYSTPTTGIEVMSRDSGETSTTQTWGSASASAFCSMVLELDTSQVPVTGSLVVQESGVDDFTASGAVTVSGALAAQESGADDFTAAGVVAVAGSLASQETGGDAFTATGTVSEPAITGSLAAQEVGTDAFSGVGVVAVAGALAATESGADTLAGNGSVTVQGSFNAAETGADDFTASGLIVVQGELSASEVGSDAFAASGMVLVQGAAAAVESGGDDFTGLGALAILGAFSAVEAGSDIFSAAGSTAGGITGSFSAVETGSDDFTASGQILVGGALAAFEVGLDGFVGDGTVGNAEIIGVLAAIETGQDQFSSGPVAPQAPPTAVTVVDREIGRVTVIPRFS